MKQLVFFLILLILTSCSKIESKEIKSNLNEIMDFNVNYTFDDYLKVLKKIDMNREYPNPNDIYIK